MLLNLTVVNSISSRLVSVCKFFGVGGSIDYKILKKTLKMLAKDKFPTIYT